MKFFKFRHFFTRRYVCCIFYKCHVIKFLFCEEFYNFHCLRKKNHIFLHDQRLLNFNCAQIFHFNAVKKWCFFRYFNGSNEPQTTRNWILQAWLLFLLTTLKQQINHQTFRISVNVQNSVFLVEKKSAVKDVLVNNVIFFKFLTTVGSSPGQIGSRQ